MAPHSNDPKAYSDVKKSGRFGMRSKGYEFQVGAERSLTSDLLRILALQHLKKAELKS